MTQQQEAKPTLAQETDVKSLTLLEDDYTGNGIICRLLQAHYPDIVATYNVTDNITTFEFTSLISNIRLGLDFKDFKEELDTFDTILRFFTMMYIKALEDKVREHDNNP